MIKYIVSAKLWCFIMVGCIAFDSWSIGHGTSNTFTIVSLVLCSLAFVLNIFRLKEKKGGDAA